MANEKNLIQIQTELQSPAVKDTDLVKYANGSNASVPSFLALMEMSRRKQLEDSSKAYDASSQKSIKDQLASALTAGNQLRGTLTGAPAGQANLTGAPTGQVNPTAAPTGIVAMGAAPANQVNPGAAPAVPKTAPIGEITGAAGGLMSLPVRHFNADSYAGGGIVAFSAGDLINEEKMLSSFPEAKRPSTSTMSDAQINAALSQQGQSADTTAAPAPQGRAPAGFQSILDSLPKVPTTTMPAPQELTREQAYANIKENQRLAGVSEDPYAETKKREDAIEARQQKEYEEYGLNRLLAQMSAFAKADPAKGFGYASALAADASQTLEQKQNEIRDKQEQIHLEFNKNMAKEEDARRRGDATGIQAALEAQKKDQLEYAKLQQADQKLVLDQQTIAAHLYSTQETANYHNRLANIAEATKPTAEDKNLLKLESLIEHDPEIQQLAKAKAMMPTDSPLYQDKQKEIYQKMANHYKSLKVPVPEWLDTAIKSPGAAKATESSWESPAWLRSIIGGPAPKTVSFDQLSK